MNIDEITKLMEAMAANKLTSFEMKDGEFKLSLKCEKEAPQIVTVAAPAAAPAGVSAAAPGMTIAAAPALQAAEETAKDAENKLKSQEALLAAYKAHADGDAAGALEQLQSVDQESLSADARVLYDAVFKEVGTSAVQSLYRTGYAAYESGDYATAITDLKKCYELDNSQGDALYFLARSYQKSGDTENAKIYYQKVVDEFPNTRKATDAQGLLDNL